MTHPATPVCPTEPTWLDSDGVEHPHTIIGCGSTNVVEDQSEPGTFDCLDCGIWFWTSVPRRGTARPTEGICSHCSAAVHFVEGIGYVSSDAGAPDFQYCGGYGGENNRHQVTQD